MRCPACRQEIEQPLQHGACPMCGAPVARATSEARVLYIITGAMFMAILCYAALVAVMELTGSMEASRPVVSDSLRRVLPGILIAVAGLEYIFALAAEKVILARGTAASIRQAAIILAAASDAIAIFGLALYFLGCGVQWFTIFLGLSAASFVYLAMKLPGYARRLEELAAADG